jgi:hypothetical protein
VAFVAKIFANIAVPVEVIFVVAKLDVVAFVPVAFVKFKLNKLAMVAERFAAKRFVEVELVVVASTITALSIAALSELKTCVNKFVVVASPTTSLVPFELEKVKPVVLKFVAVALPVKRFARLAMPVETRLVEVALVMVALFAVKFAKNASTALKILANKFVVVAVVMDAFSADKELVAVMLPDIS